MLLWRIGTRLQGTCVLHKVIYRYHQSTEMQGFVRGSQRAHYNIIIVSAKSLFLELLC